jgi:hypothetical protein
VLTTPSPVAVASWQSAENNPDLESLRGLDHVLVFAGDAEEEQTVPKKSVQLQVRVKSSHCWRPCHRLPAKIRDQRQSALTLFVMQTYLLGYEFPSTILMFSQADGKRKITVITSQSKSL